MAVGSEKNSNGDRVSANAVQDVRQQDERMRWLKPRVHGEVLLSISNNGRPMADILVVKTCPLRFSFVKCCENKKA